MSSARASRDHPAPSGGGPETPKRRGLAGRRAALALLALLALPALGWLALGSSPVRDRLRRAALAALASRLPGARLENGVRWDGFFRVVLGPLSLPSRHPGSPPLLSVERITARPRLRALLRGRLEVASVALEGVRIAAGRRGEGLRELATVLAPAGEGARGPRNAAEAPRIAFEDATVLFGSRVLGPLGGQLGLARQDGLLEVDLHLRLPGGGRGAFHLRLAPAERTLEAHLRRLSSSALLGGLGVHLPCAIEAAHLDLSASWPRGAGLASGEARFAAAIRGLVLAGARLADEPVGPMALRSTGTLRWNGPAGTLSLEKARVDLGGEGAELFVDVEVAAQPDPRMRVEVRAPALDWEAAVAFLPPALSPPRAAPPLRGTLSGWLAVSGPIRQWERWRLEGGIDPAGLSAAPGGPHTLRLARPFSFEARRPDGTPQEVVVGPENPDFVPLSELPPCVVRAVLASEDAGFYGHHGFDFGEMQEALSQSGARGRLRGASTISQQLAKNLFLGPERTLARKVREALATVALEVALGKRRLLEIYLNLVEWGPGVYGVGAAAHHWFGKDVRDLDPKEAAFLASVIPNPVRFEMYRRRGALTETFESRVKDLLLKLRAADAISEGELRRVWDERLAFAHGA